MARKPSGAAVKRGTNGGEKKAVCAEQRKADIRVRVAIAPLPGPLVAARARYGRGRRGELPLVWQQEIAGVFGLPGAWVNLDCSTVDWVGDTGELIFPQSVLGLTFNEVEVTYTAGLSVIPDGVKAACALIVKNAQSMPALNVKRSRLDTMEMEYFSNLLVDDVVKALLRPYVANRLG